MIRLKPFFAVVFSLLFFSLNAYSNAGIGYEVSYQQVDSLKYEVDFVVYRHCGSSKLNTNFTTPYVVCQTSGYKKSLDWKIVSIEEIKTECDSMGSQCSPPNTTGSGSGYERIVLRSTVDFKHQDFDTFIKSGCTSVRFEFNDCCRNSGITVGLASKYLYTYGELNLEVDGGNSSLVFTSSPLIQACCNQAVYYNVGAVDSDDDSLSYAFAEPLSSFGTGLKYSGGYSYLQPIDCYYPGSLKYPYNKPDANPPIGLHLNSETGDLIFTPTSCTEFTVFVIEVTEWRKDTSTGKMVSVGKTRRDVELRQKQCPNNNPPVITSESFEYRACEGEFICIAIGSEDKVSVPPPPAKRPKGDSTFLSWNRGIPQGKFVVTQDSFESANFCWTPDSGSARTRPYQFVVYADDDHCGGVIRTQRTFQIKVNPPAPDYTMSIDSVTCGEYKLDNSLSASALSKLYFSLSLKPILGTTAKAIFRSTYASTSTKPEDDILMTRSGSFELTYSLECGKTVVDTIVVNDFPETPVLNDLSLCFDAGDVDLTKFDSVGKPGVWTCPAYPNIINSKYHFITDSLGAGTNSITRQVYYTKGNVTSCGVQDSFEIRVNPLPKVELRDGYFCQDKSVVNLKDDRLIKLPGGGTLALGRQAWKCVDCGIYNESNIIEDINGGGLGAPQDFVLHIDDKAMPLGNRAADTIYVELEFRNVFGCYNRDTAAIAVTKVPKISFQGFPDLCWNEGVVDLKALSRVTTVNGIWKAVDSVGYASAAGLNRALKGDTLNGDTLNTLLTPRPSEGSSYTYIMRYYHDKSGCPTYRDTTLTIRGLPVPIIDEIPFSDVHKSFEPFTFCELDYDVNMKVNYAGGTWSSSNKNAILGSDFIPSAITNYNNPFKIFYDYTDIYGCQGRDSVSVVVHEQQQISIPNDTAITWYADKMSLDVAAKYKNSTGVMWIPLTGGTVDDANADQTTFRFSSFKDSVSRHLLYAQTTEHANNVCPFVEATMVLTVHPTPCMDINMDYTLSTKSLKLSPANENMSAYRWEVDGKTYTGKNPSVDLSSASDSLIWVKLIATNALGDTCISYNKINVNNGSVRNLNQMISLYPNPVKTGFAIASKIDLNGVEIRIYDGNGKLVQSQVLKGNYVDCENLTTGMYTIRVQTYDTQFIGRFVKQ